MDRIPTSIDRHLDAISCHVNGGIILGASSLNGRYWFGSLWFFDKPENVGNMEKCTAGVQLESGVNDVLWLSQNRVLLGLDTGGIETWDLEDNFRTFVHVHSVVEHNDLVSNVGHFTGSKKIVSGSHDRCVKVWDMDSMRSLHTATVHTDSITSLKCHPSDPNLFISCGLDGQVIIWDLRNSKPALLLDLAPLNGLPTSLAWQDKSQYSVACGSEAGDVIFKDTRNAMATPSHFIPHSRTVNRMEFSSSETNLLATVSDDCTAVITNVNTQNKFPERLQKLDQHTDFIHGLSWDRTGNHVYTCSWDSTVKSLECLYQAKNGIDAVPTNNASTLDCASNMNGQQVDISLTDDNAGTCTLKSSNQETNVNTTDVIQVSC